MSAWRAREGLLPEARLSKFALEQFASAGYERRTG
jgi:hypothetical protein